MRRFVIDHGFKEPDIVFIGDYKNIKFFRFSFNLKELAPNGSEAILRRFFCRYPAETADVFLEYIYNYQNYDYLLEQLKTGIYDSIIDKLIEYSVLNGFNKITIILIRYSNSISKPTSFSL